MNRHRTEVRDWMTADPYTIAPTATLLDAFGLMNENGIRRLPVVAAHNELVGMVTRSDIQRAVPTTRHNDGRDAELAGRAVHNVMAATPVTVAPDDTIQDAAEAMLEYQVSGLPVVQGEAVVGIITESDIFRLVVESWSAVLA